MSGERKLLVTGAHGFVAGNVLAQAGDEWDVHAISRQPSAIHSKQLSWHSCNSNDKLAALFREVRPHALIHTAAIADIDFAESHQVEARAANVALTGELVKLCRGSGCKLVFCSTDTVFDGEDAPYDEQDMPHPVNYYAETKIEAERMAGTLGANAVIARLSLVMGLPAFGTGNSFLARTLNALKEGREITAPAHEIRTPIDVITAASALLELTAKEHYGIFHLAGHTRVDRLTLMQLIARKFGFEDAPVAAQPAGPTPGRAARPRDVSLDNAKVCEQLKTPMHTLDEGLSIIMTDLPEGRNPYE